MCMGFICVRTVCKSIGNRRLFETRRLLQHGHQNPWRLSETRHLIEVLRYNSINDNNKHAYTLKSFKTLLNGHITYSWQLLACSKTLQLAPF